MKNQWMMKSGVWMIAAIASVVAGAVAFASVPKKGTVTDDTALYQSLSEIDLAKEKSPNFDADIASLSAQEGRYRERGLPSLANHPRMEGPIQRVSNQQYRAKSKLPTTSRTTLR